MMVISIVMFEIEKSVLSFQVKFSPFLENRLAVSTSENFGIVGTGRQHILDVSIFLLIYSVSLMFEGF